MKPFDLFLPCAGGVEELLAEEAMTILGPDTAGTIERGGIALRGDARAVMALNLESRLAQRVLVRVAHGPYRLEEDLYSLARQVPWQAWLTPRQTFKVDVTAQRSPLRSLNFAALRIKDAVCDVMREESGERPSVDTQRPQLRVMLHLTETHATVYADTSGEPLFKRGWREDKGEAPLKETLGAAMLAAAGWRGTPEQGGALLDPCCGSGTIAIEAAQIACGIAPGSKRRFAFEALAPFAGPQARAEWQAMKQQAQARVHAPAVPVFASDVAFRMVDFARRNAERAGVAQAIEFHGGDALERPAPRLPEGLARTMMVNPPYGERIEARGSAGRQRQGTDAPDDFFPRLAAHWKRQFSGWTAWLLSPDMKLPSKMRLKESRRVPMWNGPIECRLFRFDLVAGRMRDDAAPADSA
ncbi:THUMP domain-containing protein [Aquabacterium sp. A7-Y]|uniref:THUMP domain-containing class I SAM-dependent RNA methyltransferase n=1 Tax=Aquabacterium sp. A7-Y TaxID=1349605 RepID=UPI00223DEF4F|nr:THUMP domain-containing protein [Aquabacterium sp. A7-Y]MCW7538876.1 THUMP domain-containing protein [Aquabacterium sp. A7-Y]